MGKILVLLLVGISLAAATNFNCHPNACDKGTTHTTCLYKSSKPHARCGKVRAALVTPEEQQEIVKLHNHYRSLVARGLERRGSRGPQPAGQIGLLKWNDQLAEVAQRWANQCIDGHDQCRADGDLAVGQNWGMDALYPQQPSLSKIIKNWYDEVTNFDKKEVYHFTGSSPAGHYTQIVSGKTTEIGCGIMKNYDYINGVKAYRINLVCNYGPSGNFLGQPIYKAYH